MNKESETLEKLLSFVFVMGENMVGLTKGNYDEKTFIKKTYEYLQKYAISRKEQLALQRRLESIDNSSPNEALEDLEKMVNLAYQVDDEFELLDDDFGLYYDKVKKYISKAQEQEKVLSIIKEKRVDGQLIRIADNVEWYNKEYIYRHEIEYLNRDEVLTYQISQEEFDLLKRYFG